MILAAGRGERMRPLTDTVPKPLLAAGGKPLIVWHLERLAAWGVKQVVINHAHLGHVLQNALGDGSRWGLHIDWSPEGEALETAGGIALALPKLGSAPFLVLNGDVFCDLDAKEVSSALASFDGVGSSGGSSAHSTGTGVPDPTAKAQPQQAYLWLVDNPEHKTGGDFTLCKDGVILAHTDAAAGQVLTFSGIGLYQPALFADCERGKKAPLAPLLRTAMAQNRVRGERLRGRWVDVGTPQRLAALDTELQHGFLAEARAGSRT